MTGDNIAWPTSLQRPAHIVDVCTSHPCTRRAGVERSHLTRVRYDRGLSVPDGSLSVLCCFDTDTDTDTQERLRLLRECRRAVADHGVAIFRLPKDAAGSMLHSAGFAEWQRISDDRGLARLALAPSLFVAYAEARRPAPAPEPFREADLRTRLSARTATPPGTTMVVPVRNEERHLFAFFSFLERVTNHVGSRREFIVVLNGCHDRSEQIARDLASSSPLDVRVITSEPGIVPAFRAGAAARGRPGFVGKLDADVIVHPLMLDALELDMLANPQRWVTHAEPLPLDAFSRYSEPDHRPQAASRRLYFNGKASLYRSDPFQWPDVATFPERPRAEDVFFSFYLAFFVGIEAIGLAPGAFVYQQTLSTFGDLVRMLSRTRSEIRRLTAAFAGFAPVAPIFEQRIFSAGYREALARAAPLVVDVDEWVRLESTK